MYAVCVGTQSWAMDPLELDLWVIMIHTQSECLEVNLGFLKEQKALLDTEPSP